MGFDVRKLSGALGAQISGLDFKAGLTPADLSAIADALAVHQVLVIDAAEMAPGQQVQIARLFGEPEHHVFFPNLGVGLEHVTVLDSEAGQRSDRWHIDEVFLENPPCVTTLHAQILPSFGGDTAFVSMAAAYDALSPRMKAYIEGLEAIFDYTKIAELSWVRGTGGADKLSQFAGQMRWAAHPVVRTHPMTGRKSLYIEATYLRHIAGLPEGEGKALAAFLLDHMQRPEFGYRHQWRLGDFLLWDNRSVMHYAIADFTEHRRMYRVSVMPRSDAQADSDAKPRLSA
jgi:taurine dioxygenase